MILYFSFHKNGAIILSSTDPNGLDFLCIHHGNTAPQHSTGILRKCSGGRGRVSSRGAGGTAGTKTTHPPNPQNASFREPLACQTPLPPVPRSPHLAKGAYELAQGWVANNQELDHSRPCSRPVSMGATSVRVLPYHLFPLNAAVNMPPNK